MYDMFVALDVFVTLTDVRFVQSRNIELTFVALDASIEADVRAMQPLNMLDMFVTELVFSVGAVVRE